MEVQESQIRLMTRLAAQYDAVNLSQGFPNEPPPASGIAALALGLLGGTAERQRELGSRRVRDVLGADEGQTVADFLASLAPTDLDLNSQYSFPFGRPALRSLIQRRYERLYPGRRGTGAGGMFDADSCVTVTLGATEAMAAVFRAALEPGDEVILIEPLHELYPQQAALFRVKPVFCPLAKSGGGAGAGCSSTWELDWGVLEELARRDATKALVLCDPHNPTGKVFAPWELQRLCRLCLDHGLLLVSDDIYERLAFGGDQPHYLCCDTETVLTEAAGFSDADAERFRARHYALLSSVSKTFSATGWRVGWVATNAQLTQKVRAVHDQMTLQAPTPVQIGVEGVMQADEDDPAGALGREEELRERFRRRRDLLVPALEKLGFDVRPYPGGAYYVFCGFKGVEKLKHLAGDSISAARFLLETARVACVPGTAFYASDPALGRGELRFCFCRRDEDLAEAVRRLEAALLSGP